MNVHDTEQDDLDKALRKGLSMGVELAVEERLQGVCAGFRGALDQYPHLGKRVHSPTSNRSRIFGSLRWLSAAVGMAVLLIVIATLFMRTKTAWAQALETFHNFGTMVVRMKTIAPNDQPLDLGNGITYALVEPFSGIAYARQTDGKMAFSVDKEEGQEKIWFDGKKIIAYITYANVVSIAEPVTDKGQAPPYFDILATYNQYIGKCFSAREQDRGSAVYEGKSYRMIELTYESNNKPERAIFYLDPKTMQPMIMIQYLQNTHTGELLPAIRIDYQFDVPISDSTFRPIYPKDAKVVDQGKVTIVIPKM